MPRNDAAVHVVIPARLASERLPGKPLADICGRPMVVRVHERVARAVPDADIVVATDDERILEVLDAHSVPGLMTSTNCASGTDRAAEVARVRGWGDNDAIINVQGDEPLIPGRLLQDFVGFTASGLPMTTVSAPVVDASDVTDPNVVKLMTREDSTAITFSRAAIPFVRAARSPLDLTLFRRHVGLYGYRNDVLQKITSTPPSAAEQVEKLEQLRALWLGIPIHVMDWPESPPGGVDTPDDLERVRRNWQREGEALA
jgi:3-deoxy-manno-octulosonate cytidylyltransferase (CMP-KDO synthetase)